MTTVAAASTRAPASAPRYDWPKYAHDPSDTGVSHDPSISSANASRLGVRWMVPNQTIMESSPVVAYSAQLRKMVVYAGSLSGAFTAFDAATGKIVWSRNLGSAVISTPIVANGDVWVERSNAPVLYRLNAATGAVICQSPPLATLNYATPTIGTPPGRPETVFVGENGGPSYAINATSCSIEWQFAKFNTSGSGTWDPYSFAVDARGRALVLFGTDNPDQTVYAVDAATGKKIWTFKTQQGKSSSDVGTGASVTAPGVNGFRDGALYVSNNGGWTYALNLTTGALYWRFDYVSFLKSGPLRGTAAVLGRHVIIPGPTGAFCLDAVTGKVVWNWRGTIPQGGSAPSDSAAAVAGPKGREVVAFTDLSGNFDVLNGATGKLLSRHQTGGFGVTSVAESNGNFYVTSASGFLYDFAVGGSNSPAPKTSIAFPHPGTSLANPNGDLTIRGTARGKAIAAVEVAVQSGGQSGEWWDAATRQWVPGFFINQATLAKRGSSATDWTLRFPVPMGGGVYSVQASAVGSDHQADIGAYQPTPYPGHSAFTVRFLRSSPHLGVTGSIWVAPGGSIAVVGSGFQGGETIQFSLGSKNLSKTTAGPSGKFSASVPIPSPAPFGPVSLMAKGMASGRSSSTPIDISNEWQEFGNGSLHLGYASNDLTWARQIVGNPAAFITQAWSYPSGAAIHGSVAVLDAVAYFGNAAGTVTALDVHNSQVVWTYSAKSAVDASVAVASGQVIFGTTAGSVVAISRQTGKLAWRTATSSSVQSAPSFANKMVFVGTENGTVYALDIGTGAIKWRARLAGAVRGSPAVDAPHGEVVVGSTAGSVVALSMTTGHTLWSVKTGGPVTATASIDNGNVYIGSQTGTVYSLKEATGAKVWTFRAGAGVAASGAYYTAGANPAYVVGDSKGDVYFLRLTSGRVFRTLHGSAAVTGVSAALVWSAVTFADGTVLGSKFGTEIEWAFHARKAVHPVALVSSVTYVAGDDGMVRAFAIPGTQIP